MKKELSTILEHWQQIRKPLPHHSLHKTKRRLSTNKVFRIFKKVFRAGPSA